MKHLHYITILALIITTACTSSVDERPTENDFTYDSLEGSRDDNWPDSLDGEIESVTRPVVRFICRDIGQEMDNPLYEVSLLVGTSYFTLDTIHTCETIRPADYEEFEVPREAFSAAGGWWKNEGDYFYAVERPGEIVVMHAWQTEEQSTQGYFYKTKRRIMLPRAEPMED